MEKLIQENVATNEENRAKILSDDWSAYNHLNELGFEHEVIIHNEGFGSDEHTTNTIEPLWHELKNLYDYYKGIHGDADYLQQVVNYAIWKRLIKNETEEEKIYSLLSVFWATYDKIH